MARPSLCGFSGGTDDMANVDRLGLRLAYCLARLEAANVSRNRTKRRYWRNAVGRARQELYTALGVPNYPASVAEQRPLFVDDLTDVPF